MKTRWQSITILAVAVAVFGGAVVYASASPVAGAIAAKKETNKEKLAKALKACKKDKSKRKRKKCERTARHKYPVSKPGGPTKTTTTKPTTMKTTTTETGSGETPQQEMTRAATVTTTPSTTSVADGKQLFNASCETCHGPQGEGTDFGPNLHEEARAQSIAGVIDQLIEPPAVPAPMPNFDKGFTFVEKEEVADFVAVEITKVAKAA